MNTHVGLKTTGPAHPTAAAKPLPPNLADVALIDATACAAAGSMSISWWHAEVAAGHAPQPVIRAPRCTRWRLADVRAFWMAFAEKGNTDTQTAQAVTAQATKASRAAQTKRAAAGKAGA